MILTNIIRYSRSEIIFFLRRVSLKYRSHNSSQITFLYLSLSFLDNCVIFIVFPFIPLIRIAHRHRTDRQCRYEILSTDFWIAM